MFLGLLLVVDNIKYMQHLLMLENKKDASQHLNFVVVFGSYCLSKSKLKSNNSLG